jgi:DNA-binding transcriptional LysR family regulator
MKLVDLNNSVLSRTNKSEPNEEERGTRPHARLYDKRKFRITLKQWRMLHAVIDCDGFTAAAEYLHVSQSAISYTIAKMQEQLGIPLLRIEGRKAHVTEQGRALLEHSRNVIRSAIELETLAEKMRLGWEPELRLMVHHDCPHAFTMAAIREFSAGSPGVHISLLDGGDRDLEIAVATNAVELAICAQVPPGHIADRLVSVEYVPVAHPDHKLARIAGVLDTAELARHTRIMIDKPGQAREGGREAGRVIDASAWRFSSFDSALAALEECLGYAWMPRERIRHRIDAGALKVLPLSGAYHTTRDFYLVHAAGAAPGAGASSLAGMLHAHAALYAAGG